MIRRESYALEDVIKGQLKKRILTMGPEFQYLFFEIFDRLEKVRRATKKTSNERWWV